MRNLGDMLTRLADFPLTRDFGHNVEYRVNMITLSELIRLNMLFNCQTHLVAGSVDKAANMDACCKSKHNEAIPTSDHCNRRQHKDKSKSVHA